MKICIPTEDDRGLDSTAFNHFGSAPFFTLVDVESGGTKVMQNPECHEHHRSCHHIQLLKAHDVDAVVCEGIGRRAHAGLREAGIDVLVPSDGTIAGIVATATAGGLQRLSADDACGGGRRHHGHRAGAGHGRRHGHGQPGWTASRGPVP